MNTNFVAASGASLGSSCRTVHNRDKPSSPDSMETRAIAECLLQGDGPPGEDARVTLCVKETPAEDFSASNSIAAVSAP